MLPWLVGAAVVAGVSYMASGDDEPEECIYCSKPVYRNDMCRKHYRAEQREERESLIREQERDNKRQIESEISSFKQTSQRQIRNKYGVDISFSGKSVDISDTNNGKVANLKSYITELESENIAIENLLNDLQSEKNAI